jgi:hypothetical protein
MTDPLAQSIVNQMWGVAGTPPPGAPAERHKHDD